jgi:hypothetical protein
MPATINPYAPPKAAVEDVVAFSGEADEIRREHIQREAAIRSIGILYYIGGAALTLLALGALAGSNAALGNMAMHAKAPLAVMGVIFLGFGVGTIFVGRGLRNFRPWARITSIVIAILGLANPPVGTLVNIYILYLLFSEKGRRIFESDYPEIVAATPDVKAKTSIVVWLFLGILVLAILAAVLVPALVHHR